MPYDINGKRWDYPTDKSWTKEDVNLEHALHSISKKARFNDQLYCDSERWNVLKHSLSLVMQALLLSDNNSIGRKLILELFYNERLSTDSIKLNHCQVFGVNPTTSDLKYLLVHDLPEAYIGDVITPLKQIIFKDSTDLFNQIEQNIMAGFFDSFALSRNNINYPLVKGLDSACVFREFVAFGSQKRGPSIFLRHFYEKLNPMNPSRPKDLDTQKDVEALYSEIVRGCSNSELSEEDLTSLCPMEAYFPCLINGARGVFPDLNVENLEKFMSAQEVSIRQLVSLDRNQTVDLFRQIVELIQLWESK